jgi:hypothetical protein
MVSESPKSDLRHFSRLNDLHAFAPYKGIGFNFQKHVGILQEIVKYCLEIRLEEVQV